MYIRLRTIVSLLLLMPAMLAIAAPVGIQKAELAARNFWQLNSPQHKKDLSALLILKDVFTIDDDTLIYVFGGHQAGFLLISGEDRITPCLAYSFDSYYNPETPNPAFRSWIDFLLTEISFAKTDAYTDFIDAKRQWKELLSGGLPDFTPKNSDVAPLILSKWDQGLYYNALCPEDLDGPGQRVYAGCVATMMAQLMNYYKYPLSGTGSAGYYSNYGYLSVNFSNSIYDYYSMPLQLTAPNTDVAKLIYDCGVAVSMNYSPNGSGAFMTTARDAMVSYFGFSQQSVLLSKNNYSQQQWSTMLIDELENGRPMMYAGYPGGGAGHAFILDGVQNGNYFHFNWGWSGSFDGYFLLSALSPGSHNFTNWQSAIMHVYPASTYPSYCSGKKTISSVRGVIFDGSGPAKYSDLSDCTWLLSPTDLVTNVTLTFNRFETELNNDFLIIYEGPDTNSTVVAVISGDTLHPPITVAGPEVLLRFVSNDSVGKGGFDISYSWALQLFCSGTNIITDPAGSFSDGSGPHLYRSGTNCRWLIDPPGAESINLSFTSFETEEGIDLVRVYDPTTMPSTLMATYSGSVIPPPLTVNAGRVLVIFQTNQSVNKLGWEAVYSSTPLKTDDHTLPDTDVKVFPLPATDRINLVFQKPAEEFIEYRILDIQGRLQLEGIIPPAREFSIPLHTLSNSVYLLHLYTANGPLSRKIILAK